MENPTDDNKQHPTPEERELARAQYRQQLNQTFRVAAAMLWQDRSHWFLWYPLLILPAFLALWGQPLDYGLTFSVETIRRTLELLFLYSVTTRWLTRLSVTEPPKFSLNKFLLFGFGIWLVMQIPLIFLRLDPQHTLWSFGFFVGIPAVALGLYYFFYFVPAVVESLTFTEILNMARSITLARPFLPLRALFPPLAVMIFLNALVLLPSPNEREIGVTVARIIVSGSFWVLACYLSLAYFFTFIGDKQWRMLKLDPYREGRLETLQIQAPRRIPKICSTSGALQLVVVSAFLGLFSWMNLASRKPPIDTTINSIAIEENVVILDLTLSDVDKKNFRGFDPYSFNLASEKGTIILKGNPTPARVIVDDKSIGHGEFASQYQTTNQVRVRLRFATERNAQGLQHLEDLYLWHFSYKLLPLPMSTATIIEKADDNSDESPLENEKPDQRQATATPLPGIS